MGKKEKLIKKLNAEYYKEQNADYYNENKLSKEDKLKEIQELQQYRAEEKFENIINCIIQSIKDYTEHQGLLIFDNLNVENLERYVKFIINHSSFMKETNKNVVKKVIEKIKHNKPEKNNKKADEDETKIIQRGIKILEDDYIKIHDTLPDDFHKKLLDEFGYNEYHDTVFFLGKLT